MYAFVGRIGALMLRGNTVGYRSDADSLASCFISVCKCIGKLHKKYITGRCLRRQCDI